jgi:hypothetical protein
LLDWRGLCGLFEVSGFPAFAAAPGGARSWLLVVCGGWEVGIIRRAGQFRRASIIFSDSAEVVEVVEQDIIDTSLEVGSGCEWRGSGAEPQWDNPKSTKAYDHIARHHGPKLKADNLRGRAAGTKTDQGQWFNELDWVKAEKGVPKYPGEYIIDFKRPIGRVYHPDGTITENVSRAFIQRNPDGALNSGYPILDNLTLVSLKRRRDRNE